MTDETVTTPPVSVTPEMALMEKAAELTRYHAADTDQIEKMARVRNATAALIEAIVINCPPCADRSAAIRKVREALMTSNAAIVLPEIKI